MSVYSKSTDITCTSKNTCCRSYIKAEQPLVASFKIYCCFQWILLAVTTHILDYLSQHEYYKQKLKSSNERARLNCWICSSLCSSYRIMYTHILEILPPRRRILLNCVIPITALGIKCTFLSQSINYDNSISNSDN